MMRSVFLLLFCCTSTVLPLSGQDRGVGVGAEPASHTSRLTQLVVECLDTPLSARQEDAAALDVGWSGPLSFLEAHLSAQLMARGIPLGGTDASALSVRMEEGSIEYERAGRKRFTRRVDVALQYTLTQPDGRVVATDACSRSAEDTLTRRQAQALAVDRYDVTSPDIPPTGLWRRYLEPAVLVAATAIGTYLFFNLRSRRTDSG